MPRIPLAALLTLCAPAVASAQSLADEGKALEAARAAKCADTCCIPHVDRFEWNGAPAADVQRARHDVATATDPGVLALALRMLTPGATDADVPAIATRIDDTRSGGQLPSVVVTQRVMPCYPVHWEPVTVASEALAALSRIHATAFRDAAAYRAWAAAHPDPDATFDAWYAKLDRQRPPEADLLAKLRKRDPVLVARVMAAYCDDTDSCGLTHAELAALFEKAGGGDRMLRWLARTEQFPEWKQDSVFAAAAASIVRVGDTVFTATHVAPLDKLMRTTALPTWLRARLAVMLGRMKPADAQKLWTWALHDLDAGHDAILHEAAAREPVAFADTLATWYGKAGGADAILRGLADAGPRGAATFKRLLTAHPLAATDDDLLRPAAAAARAVGCANVPDPDQLIPHLLKSGNASAQAAEQARLAHVRSEIVGWIRACVPKLP